MKKSSLTQIQTLTTYVKVENGVVRAGKGYILEPRVKKEKKEEKAL